MPISIPRLLTGLPGRSTDAPSEIKLLPCPCCGGAASFAGSIFAPCVQCRACGLSTARIDCSGIQFDGPGIPFDGKDIRMHLARQWNRRNDSSFMLAHLAHISGALVHGISKYCNEVGCDIDAGLLSEVRLIREMCMEILKEGQNGT